MNIQSHFVNLNNYIFSKFQIKINKILKHSILFLKINFLNYQNRIELHLVTA